MTGLLVASLLASGSAGACPPQPWPLWQAYSQRFLSSDGRVIDSQDQRTTSEGQAYALFHALVAGDRAAFDKVLQWTSDNLARGSLQAHLPAWHWGHDKKGWRVLDPNSASDSDLWIAYTLLEAGRLWSDKALGALGAAVALNVVKKELVELPGLGPAILPAPFGFELAKGRAWRLNPSYLPLQLPRRFAASGLPGPWEAVLASSTRMISFAASRGLVADWVRYDAVGGFRDDSEAPPVAGYEAIRVYLWAALMHPDQPGRRDLLAATAGLSEESVLRGYVPEKVDLTSPHAPSLRGPPGFLSVAAVDAAMRDQTVRARSLDEELQRLQKDGLYGEPPTYYDQNLILFAKGFQDGRYYFAPDGALVPRWAEPCTDW